MPFQVLGVSEVFAQDRWTSSMVRAGPWSFWRGNCSGSSLHLQLSLKYLQEPGSAGIFENILARDLLIKFDLI